MLWTAGGMGVSGPVPRRERLVAAEGAASGIDPDVPAGRGANPGAGASAESGVVSAELAGVGGASTAAPAGGEAAGGLRQSARPQDRPSQRGAAAGGAEDDQVSAGEVKGQIHALLAPLTEVQKRLLELWDLPPDLYEKLVCGFPISAMNRSELLGAGSRSRKRQRRSK